MDTQNLHNLGLARYCSAPSSFFDDVVDDNGAANCGPRSGDGVCIQSLSRESETLLGMQAFEGREVAGVSMLQDNDYGSASSHMMYGKSAVQDPENQGLCGVAITSGYQNLAEVKTGAANGLNLLRHNSSPAGLISNLGFENGFNMMSDTERSMLQLNEARNGSSILDFSRGSWAEDPSRIQNLLHFQGSVLCKMRAKRGCATHPRSIAERERRNRINERIKKLEDLFPEIDKQMSTADKLDFAVLQIKDLQRQIKALKDTREKCSCSGKK